MRNIGPCGLADKPPVTETPPAIPVPVDKPTAPTAADLSDIKGSPFLLSQREWLSVQRYVTNAMALPITEGSLRLHLQMPEGMKFDDFQQLLAGHNMIVPHVTQWKTVTYPATVALAADIAHYGSSAPTMYGGLLKFVDQLLVDRKNSAAKDGLTALVEKLAKEASEMSTKAKTVHADIQAFAHQTATDAVLIDSLVAAYAKKFDSNSAWGKDTAKKLKRIRDDIETHTKIYEYAKAVACSTPAYAWIVVPPIGLIAAIIVAGVYGDIAIKANQRLDLLKKELRDASADELVVLNLNCSLDVTNHGLASIQTDIKAALPVIQKIQGVWAAIHSDLIYLGEIISEDIDKAIAEIKDMGVEKAITQWKELKIKADAYRANAYIEAPAA